MKGTMRNWLKVFVLLSDEIALVLVVFFLLPKLGIYPPLWLFITLFLVLGVFSFLLYKLITPQRKIKLGSEALIGIRGKVVTPLNPEGFVQIGGELWKASSAEGRIGMGEEVIVVSQRGLKLMVRHKNSTDY